jgi:hypothetical protein
LVLHLERVARHAARDGQFRYRLMRQRTWVEHRLHRVDQPREATFDNPTVDVLDAGTLSGNTRDRMQHDEADAARLETRLGGRFAAVFEPAVRMGVDLRDAPGLPPSTRAESGPAVRRRSGGDTSGVP